MSMKKTILLAITCMCICLGASAQRNSGRLSLGVGLLYKNGAEMTLAYEHEMNYRHTWEFFANGYLQWSDCRTCGHICPESFWRNYRTWGIRCSLQALCNTRKEPLWESQSGSIWGQRHPQVCSRNTSGLRTQLCTPFRLDFLLAGKERCNNQGG